MASDGNVKEVLKRIHETGEYADVTIVVGSRTLHCHSAIICPQSDFFKAVINGPFLESHSKTIKLGEDIPRAVEAMLSYMYTEDYEAGVENAFKECVTRGISNAYYNFQVYMVAEKYNVAPLKELAWDRFMGWLYCNSANPRSVDVIRHVWVTLPEHDHQRRTDIVRAVAQSIEDTINNPKTADLLEEFGSIGVEVLKIVIQTQKKGNMHAPRGFRPRR